MFEVARKPMPEKVTPTTFAEHKIISVKGTEVTVPSST